MNHLIKVVDRYIANGDPASMEKVRKFLSEKYDFNNLTPEYIHSFPLLDLATDAGFHLNLDIHDIQTEQDRKNQIASFITIIRTVLLTYFNVLKKEDSYESALDFINECEETLEFVNVTQSGLNSLIAAIPFEKLREESMSKLTPIANDSQKLKQHFYWCNPNISAYQLCEFICNEYNIIKAPTKLEKLLKGDNNVRIKVNQDKIGHFIFLIKSLLGLELNKKYKWLQVKKNRGFFVLLSTVTFNYRGEKIAKDNSFFKNLSFNLSDGNQINQLIINEIEEILNELERQ